MIFGGILVGLIIMTIMITMAVRKKSDKITRIAAIIALGVMCLAVIICIIIIFTDTSVAVDPSRLIVGEPVETKKTRDDAWIMVILIAFLIAVFVLVAVFAKKEAKKHPDDYKNSKPISNW